MFPLWPVPSYQWAWLSVQRGGVIHNQLLGDRSSRLGCTTAWLLLSQLPWPEKTWGDKSAARTCVMCSSAWCLELTWALGPGPNAFSVLSQMLLSWWLKESPLYKAPAQPSSIPFHQGKKGRNDLNGTAILSSIFADKTHTHCRITVRRRPRSFVLPFHAYDCHWEHVASLTGPDVEYYLSLYSSVPKQKPPSASDAQPGE